MEQSMFLVEIDNIREKIIQENYEKAKQELKEKVRHNPLQTEYTLFEVEPLQIEMATEIAKRLFARNKCVTHVNTRFYSSVASISVKLELPNQEPKLEDTKLEEAKLEEPKVEEPKLEEPKLEEATL